MKNKFYICTSLLFFLVFYKTNLDSHKLINHKIQNLQFVANLDGNEILKNVNLALNNKKLGITDKSFLWFGRKKPTPLDKINSENPALANLWKSTSMMFGAAADGVGFGTSFAIKKSDDGKMLFLTNFHVVEQFCKIPEDAIADFSNNDDTKYACQALFVLHDIAINTNTNIASIDGELPFKSEVNSLLYFDKEKDLAVFKINMPADNNIEVATIEKSYDLNGLFIMAKNAEKNDPNLLPDVVNGIKMYPVTAFTLYLAAYSIPKPEEQTNPELAWIKKHWFKGKTEGIQTFENEKKLGFVNAFKHDIEVVPGTSGAAMALSDGRVIGINTCIETKQFYAKHGILWWKKDVLETYKSNFAMPSLFLNDFFDKLN